MASEPLLSQRRPGFPQESITASAYVTRIEYVGLETDLRSGSPNLNSVWGDYKGRVTVTDLLPLEGTEHAILTVVCELKVGDAGAGGGAGGEGTLLEQTITTEIDWMDVNRSLYEHPDFRVGGNGDFELDPEDVLNLKSWEKNPNTEEKAAYKFRKDSNYEDGNTSDETLSVAAKTLAYGLLQGIEYWVYKAPVVRYSADYVNGPPPAGNAGVKDDPTGVVGVPDGYEWVRNSDRGIRKGSQATWAREIEWIGTDKVLIDAGNVYWDTPS